jgi:hypothetical protein
VFDEWAIGLLYMKILLMENVRPRHGLMRGVERVRTLSY